MLCKKCGNELKQGQKFCGKCGTKNEIYDMTKADDLSKAQSQNTPAFETIQEPVQAINKVDKAEGSFEKDFIIENDNKEEDSFEKEFEDDFIIEGDNQKEDESEKEFEDNCIIEGDNQKEDKCEEDPQDDLESEDSQNSTKVISSHTENSSSKRGLLAIASVVAAVVIGSGAYFFMRDNDALIKDYIAAYNQKDYQKIYQMVDFKGSKFVNAQVLKAYIENKESKKGSVYALKNGRLEDIKVLGKKEKGDIVIYDLEGTINGLKEHFFINIDKTTKKVIFPEDELVNIEVNVPKGTIMVIDGTNISGNKIDNILVGKHIIELNHPILNFEYDKNVVFNKSGKLAIISKTSIKNEKVADIEKVNLNLINVILNNVMHSDEFNLDNNIWSKNADSNGKFSKMHKTIRNYYVSKKLEGLTAVQTKMISQKLLTNEDDIQINVVYTFSGNTKKGSYSNYMSGTLDVMYIINEDDIKAKSLNSFNIHIQR